MRKPDWIGNGTVLELVRASQVVLRSGVPLGGGFLIPLPRRGKILRNTFAEVIEQPELVWLNGAISVMRWHSLRG